MKIANLNITINRKIILTAVDHAVQNMERNFEDINLLNVFPIPDGDTGINMLLTLKSIQSELIKNDSDDPTSLLENVNRGALLGARGNSGVILSQFIRGFCSALSKSKELNANTLNAAFQQGTSSSYEAVSDPVEGTMLTVMKGVSDSVKDLIDSGETNLIKIFQDSISQGVKTLESTPDLLPILKKAGVVDAGGQGFLIILDGIWRLISKIHENQHTIPIHKVTGKINHIFFEESKILDLGFCTQFLIKGQNLDQNIIKVALSEFSNSIVAIGEYSLLRIHAHTEKPETIIEIANSFGIVSEINIQNMNEQHEEFLDLHKYQIHKKDISIISIVNGKGLEKIFRTLGSDFIINGGQAHNPSVQELLDVIESMQATSGILLTNNSNVLPAANQAISLSEKNIQVIPTKNIPEGIAALLSYSDENSLMENYSNMTTTIDQIISGEIVTAIRDVKIESFQVKAGEYIGFINGKLLTSNTTIKFALKSLLEKITTKTPELITLYWGGELTNKIAENIYESIRFDYSNIEIELLYGGQDFYHFLISVE